MATNISPSSGKAQEPNPARRGTYAGKKLRKRIGTLCTDTDASITDAKSVRWAVGPNSAQGTSLPTRMYRPSCCVGGHFLGINNWKRDRCQQACLDRCVGRGCVIDNTLVLTSPRSLRILDLLDAIAGFLSLEKSRAARVTFTTPCNSFPSRHHHPRCPTCLPGM